MSCTPAPTRHEIVDTTAGIGAPAARGEMDPMGSSRVPAWRNITTRCPADPVHAEEYAATRRALADIDDSRRCGRLDGARGRRFLVFHPVGYLAEDFWLAGGHRGRWAGTSAAEMADTALARTEGTTWCSRSPAEHPRGGDDAAELGGRVVLVDPLAEDWLGNLRAVAAALAEAFTEQ